MTLVLRPETREQVDRVRRSVEEHYPGMQIMVETDSDMPGVKTVKHISNIVSMINTKYVLLADDVDYVSNWTNIERAVGIFSTASQ